MFFCLESALFAFSSAGNTSLLELLMVLIKQRRRFYPSVVAFILSVPFLIAQLVKNPPAMQGAPVRLLG